MKNKNIVKILAIFILTILLVSTFALPVFATVDPDPGTPAAFLEELGDAILYVVELILGIIAMAFLIIIVIVYLAFSAVIELGEAIIGLIMLIVNAIIGLF